MGFVLIPPLCRGTSQGMYGLRIIGLVCKGETVGKIGEVDEMGERELSIVVSVKCGKEWDMTRGWQLFLGHKDILSFATLEPRVFAWRNVFMLCNSVRAVFVGVLFRHSVGWLEVFLQATETCANSEKNHQSSGLEECWEFPLLVFHWVWSHVDDDDAVCKVGPRSFEGPPTCSRVNCVVILSVALKSLSFSLSYLSTTRNGPVFFLAPYQVLVVQQFAFSFCLSTVVSWESNASNFEFFQLL